MQVMPLIFVFWVGGRIFCIGVSGVGILPLAFCPGIAYTEILLPKFYLTHTSHQSYLLNHSHSLNNNCCNFHFFASKDQYANSVKCINACYSLKAYEGIINKKVKTHFWTVLLLGVSGMLQRTQSYFKITNIAAFIELQCTYYGKYSEAK